MFRKTSLLAALLLVLGSQAQDRDCAATRITQRYLQEQGLSSDVLHALPQVSAGARGGVYTVPIVVHVLWNTAGENVPDAAILAIIDEMNEDYSQSNSDLSGVRPAFTGVIGNAGIQFCLAQIDPNGNATTGITRTQTTETWFDPDTETNEMKEPPTGVSPWDPDHYLNIWICDITSGAIGGTITVGYAYLPTGGVVGSGIDGLVIDYNYGLDVGGRTATHEIGHYFGLMHTFDEGGDCLNSDGFADTPTSDSPTFSCSNTSLMKCGVLTQYENFMDYSNCTAMFTDQQTAYMVGILTGIRSSLLDENLCGGGPSGICIPTATVGTAEGDYINGVQLGTINNTNSGGTSEPAYTDFSATWSTSLQQNGPYSITIQSGNYTPDHYAAWIDYDQDDTFEAGEKLGEFTNTAVGESQAIPFTVPAGATLGATTLRVRGVFHNDGEPTPSDPCFDYVWGETEDYAITITSASSGACIPTSANGTTDGDFINGVELGAINNVNSGGDGEPTYTDFSSTWSTSLTRGDLYSMDIQSGDYTPDHYAAWIDYDHDNSFEAGEKLGEFTNTSVFQTQSIGFTVPMSAMLGATTMRVRGVYHGDSEPSPTDPCFNYAYAETEDYAVTIEVNTGASELAGSAVRIYPNPAAGTVMIELPTNELALITLLDPQGRVIQELIHTSSLVRLSLADLAAGHYAVRVLQGERMSVHRLQISALGAR